MGIITFNGVNSDTLGIRVSTFPSYQIPERETNIITIPGKDGEVIQHTNFKNVDREYEVSFPVTEDFESQSSEIANWLLSTNEYARLEDTYSPDVYRLGMYKDSDIIENIYNQAGKATIRFSCKPQRFLKIPESSYYYMTKDNTEWNNYSLPDSYDDNHNLLDNGLFTDNHRGQISYIGAVQYTVDRWKTTNVNTSVYCLDRGIRIFNNTPGSGGYLLQVIDDYKQLLGKTLTYSVMLGDGRVISASATMPSVTPTENTTVIILYDGGLTIGSLMFYNVSGNIQLWARIWSNSNENERTFVAVKLEIGSQQTLAHKENGVWVLNEIPDYGEHHFTSMAAKPIIKLDGSGDYEFVFGTEPDITYRINNLSLTKGKIVIDCENQNVYLERDGTNKNSDFIITGGNEFPYITPGCDFTIRSLNGNWCDIFIIPNWWHW